MIRIKLDGSFVDKKEYSDINTTDIVLQRLNNNAPSSSFSSNITFTGSAANYIKDKLVTSSNYQNNTILIEVVDFCCSEDGITVYRGKIIYSNVDFCEYEDRNKVRCTITISSTEYTIYSELLNCIRQKLIIENQRWDDGVFFWDRKQPQIPYCHRITPRLLQDIIIVLCCIFVYILYTILPILLSITLVVGVINVIIDLVASLTSGTPEKIKLDSLFSKFISFAKDLKNLLTKYIPRWMTGCERYQYAPKIRDYIENVCQQCGVKFKSSILKNDASIYNDLVLVFAQNKEGSEDGYYTSGGALSTTKVYEYFTNTSPVWTGGYLLDRLAEAFNAVWWVDDATLYFEPNKTNEDLLIDLTYDTVKIIRLCYSWETPNELRAVDFKFQEDVLDNVGDEARYLYNDFVPFDTITFKSSMTQIKEIALNFGASRFRGDDINQDPLKFWEFIFTPLSWLGVSPIKPKYKHNLLMANGKCAFGKLIVLEKNYNNVHALPIRKGNNYNYPIWFAAAAAPYNPDGRYNEPFNSKKRLEHENLFQFHRFLDPTLYPQKGSIKFELEIKKDCNLVTKLYDAFGFNSSKQLYVLIPKSDTSVKGYIERVTIKSDILQIEGFI